MIYRFWLVLLVVLLLDGCVGTQPARELSRETLANLVEYEQQVRETSRLLQAYYRKTLSDLGDDYKWMQHTVEITSRGTAAEDAVDRLVTDDYSAKHFRDYLASVSEATASERARYASLRAKLEAAEAQAIKEVAIEESTFKAMRAKLEFLQREPSLRDRADQIRPLINTAIQSLRSPKKTTGGGS